MVSCFHWKWITAAFLISSMLTPGFKSHSFRRKKHNWMPVIPKQRLIRDSYNNSQVEWDQCNGPWCFPWSMEIRFGFPLPVHEPCFYFLLFFKFVKYFQSLVTKFRSHHWLQAYCNRPSEWGEGNCSSRESFSECFLLQYCRWNMHCLNSTTICSPKGSSRQHRSRTQVPKLRRISGQSGFCLNIKSSFNLAYSY